MLRIHSTVVAQEVCDVIQPEEHAYAKCVDVDVDIVLPVLDRRHNNHKAEREEKEEKTSSRQVQAPNECSDAAGTSDALATGVLDYESVTAATTLLSWSSTEEASVAEETTVCYTVGNPAGAYEAPEGPYASFSIDLPLVTAEPTAQTQVLSGAAGQMLATVGDGTTQTVVATFIGIFLALIATCCVVAIVVAIIAITVTAKRKKILGGRERRKSMADSDDIQLAVLQASKRGEGDSAMTAEGSTFDASGKALPVGWKRHFDEEENLSYYVGEDERECCVLSLFTSFFFRSPVSPTPLSFSAHAYRRPQTCRDVDEAGSSRRFQNPGGQGNKLEQTTTVRFAIVANWSDEAEP